MSWKSKRGPQELLFYFTSPLFLFPSPLALFSQPPNAKSCQFLLILHFPDMGSLGNPISSPYTTSYNNYNYRDCSLEICSIYCPQFCYLIFPPPPPSDDGTPFSPLIIAIIGVLASAFILVSYYTIVTRYCRRRNPVHSSNQDQNDHGMSHDQLQNGLDESQIRTITVLKYQKGEGLVEGNECAVCLSEFQENESLRLLPKCDHAFHLPCIDTWLKSHSNCPMCRANAVPTLPASISGGSEARACEVRRPDDLVLVVDDQEMVGRVVCEGGNEQEGERSGFPHERPLMISDILRIDEDLGVKDGESSKRRDKGKSSSVLPH